MKTRKNPNYNIPPERLPNVVWVNSTPHLSRAAAGEHKEILAMGAVTYPQYSALLHSFLSALLTTDLHRGYNDYWYELAARGPERVYRTLADVMADTPSASYMLEKLEKNVSEAVVESALEEHAEDDINKLARWVSSLPANPLNDYERKLFAKYAGDSSRRTGEGYIKQVRENYLPTRTAWVRTKVPVMARYERSLAILKRVYAIEASFEGNIDMTPLTGYLSRARSTTFGGYPYMRNMADFVSDDETDPTTYADLYNKLAIGWLYLDPRYKRLLYPSFVALERVQPGGVEEYHYSESLSAQSFKANKQRFVQAQSAVISHAHKFIVDAMNNLMRARRPTMCADKFGEPMVTQEMKRLCSIAYGKMQPSADDKSIQYNVVGTDYSNFDASQDISLSNDCHYMQWRRLCPAWMTYYIIDPYVLGTYSMGKILVPRYGLVRTTGVKSGMIDTNQCDTANCGLADTYELCYYSDMHPDHYLSDDMIITLLGYCMDNGDDRYKLTYLDAAEIEAADSELGFIAQKSKQEVEPVGTKFGDFGVTFLKTILALADGKSVRTDAISKLILARIHPESTTSIDHPASMLVDFFMSASRSVESPHLYVLVDYMYCRLPLFRDLLAGTVDFRYIIDHMVAEQMNILFLQRGKKWMRRKGMDYDMMIERINTKYGYGEEGYRGNVGAIDHSPTSLELLPQVQAILACAFERVARGTIGATFATTKGITK